MDKVFIEGLEIEALIGIYDWERRIRQPLVLDLEMAFDNRRPAATDAIADTLDYKAVSKRLIAFVSQSSFGLVETLAERCAAIVLHEFGVEHVRLKLSKPGAVRGARAVGVVIERNRADVPAPVREAEPAPREAVAPAPTPSAATSAPSASPVADRAPEPIASRAPPPGAAPMPARGAASTAESAADPEPVPPPTPMRRASDRPKSAVPAPEPRVAPVSAPKASAPAPSRADAMIAAIAGLRGDAPAPVQAQATHSTTQARKLAGSTCPAYLSLGSNIEPERNLRMAVAALRARFGEVTVSPVYRTKSVGFDGPDFLNAIALVHSDLNPFALHRWLHRLEEAQGRDRRDATYSNRPLDVDIIYFGDFVLEGPGDFQLPRPELQHAFVLKPLADIAPDFVDPIRSVTLAQLWAIHPDHDTPPARVELAL